MIPNRPPDHVNEKGVKWWLDKSATHYARREAPASKPLKDSTAWITEEPDGSRSYLLIRSNEIVACETSVEAFGAKIDMLRLAENT